MKKAIMAVTTLVTAASACGQTSVTIYGLIDAGLTHTSRTASDSNQAVQFVSGSSQGSRLGFKGTEELGGGTKAVFVLENGFDVGNGKAGQGGLLFGRQAFAGMSGQWGSLTLGRQYDFIGDVFPAYAVASNTPAGLLGWSLPAYAAGGYALDNRVWGVQVDKSIKYQSAPLHGVAFGVMVGLRDMHAATPTPGSSNALLSYDSGPLSAALAFMAIHDAAGTPGTREYAGGAAYNVGRLRYFGMVSDVRVSDGPALRATTYEGGIAFQATQPLSLAAGVLYQDRNNVHSANQLVLSADYFLSRRTDVYLVGAIAHDRGYSAQVQAALGEVSGTSVQSAVRAGMRHVF